LYLKIALVFSIALFTLYVKHAKHVRSVLFLCPAALITTRSQQILMNAKIANAKKQTHSLAVNSVDASNSVVPLKVTVFYILFKMTVFGEVSEH